MAGNASETETAAVLIALRTKGETVDELVGLAATMRRFATPVKTARDDLIDTAGTGGGRQTFNVSTTAALIAAGAGCAVAKHGNRSATGLSGSADVLEALGVRIDLAPEAVARCIEEVGFGFMFAPAHHGATRFVVPVRKELAVRTIFNFLGPLTNPAGRDAAGDRRERPRLPRGDRRARSRGSARGARSSCPAPTGSTSCPRRAATRVVEVDDGELRSLRRRAGGRRAAARRPTRTSRAGRRTPTPRTTRRILAGEAGPARDLAVLNAGAAIYAAGRADGLEAGRAGGRGRDRRRRRGGGARPRWSRSRLSWRPS